MELNIQKIVMWHQNSRGTQNPTAGDKSCGTGNLGSDKTLERMAVA